MGKRFFSRLDSRDSAFLLVVGSRTFLHGTITLFGFSTGISLRSFFSLSGLGAGLAGAGLFAFGDFKDFCDFSDLRDFWDFEDLGAEDEEDELLELELELEEEPELLPPELLPPELELELPRFFLAPKSCVLVTKSCRSEEVYCLEGESRGGSGGATSKSLSLSTDWITAFMAAAEISMSLDEFTSVSAAGLLASI